MKVVPELDGTLSQSYNCGPAAVAMALRWATGDELKPTAPDVRARMHVADKTPTTSGDQETAWDAFAPVARKAGLRLDKAHRVVGGVFAGVKAAIDAGYGVLAQIHYGVVNNRRPDLSGDPAFDEGHSVFVSLDRVTITGREYKVWDPLCDGRRSSIPHGPQWYPEALLRDAMAGFAGNGHATYTAVRKAQSTQPPTPPDRVTALTARIDELEQALGTARTALQAVNTDAIASALEDIAAVLHAPADTGAKASAGAIS